jgi:tetratricopeptide (TPR) repeat protein
MGIAFLGKPVLLVLPPERSASRDALLRHYVLFFRHELGHVFGIPHVTGRSVMNASPNRMNSEFGILDLEVLRANRSLDFTSGLPFAGSDLTLLRDAYLLLTERGTMETALLVNLGSALYHAARYADAVEVFQTAAARDRHAARPRLGEARCVLALGDTAAARDLLAAADPFPAWTPEELEWLGAAWFEAGDFERSRAALTDAVTRDPARPEAWFNLGLVLVKEGNGEDAAAAFRRYLALAPDGDRSADARAYLDGR